MLSRRYRWIIAKTDKNRAGYWLPLWMHLRDTAGVMEKLVRKWLPESVIEGSGMEDEKFLKLAVYLAACHDCGKATSCFQSIISLNCSEMFQRLNDSGLLVKREYFYRDKTPHAFAGQCILQSGMAGVELDESVAGIIGAHHGKPMDEIKKNDAYLIEMYPANFYGKQGDEEQKKRWSNIWKEIADAAVHISNIKDIEEVVPVNINAQVLLSGLLIVADWLASNTEYFPLISLDDDVDESIYPSRIETGWKRIHFPEGWTSEINIMDEEVFAKRFDFRPNEVQSSMFEVVNHCLDPGVFIVEAQMGCGKTEAALSAAEILANKTNCSGMLFALPTQATSNGIYQRLHEWAERVSEDTKSAIELAHSGAQFNEKYQKQRIEGQVLVDDAESMADGLMVHPWFQGNKKALLADFVIGTVDQFLMGALKKKHFMLRHLGLAGKVVVIDECHAYDAYMNIYLDRMLAWMASYNIPVILLSATLPAARRKEIIAAYVKTKDQVAWQYETGYPLITWTDGREIHQKKIDQDIKNKYVSVGTIDARKSLTKILDEKLSDGGCACIIANTVKRAQEYYDMVVHELKKVNAIMYHAQYLMSDRTKKEQELLKKMGKESKDKDRSRLVLIGTQVLEQSLDYDADIMFTEICPMDLLLQRIGRLHRHERNDMEKGYSRPEKLASPECYLLMDKDGHEDYQYDEGSKTIYGDYLLLRTKAILPKILNIPADIPRLVQSVYNEEDDLGLKEMPNYAEMCNDYSVRKGKKKSKAKTYLLKKPKDNLTGILINENQSSDDGGERQVRDAGIMLEVILMRDIGNGCAGFLDVKEFGDHKILKNSIPDDEMSRRILRQRIRLPQIFSTNWMIDATIAELEMRQKELAAWQKSPWLSGELVILFDENNETSLNGYGLTYDFMRGLVYYRQEDEDGK